MVLVARVAAAVLEVAAVDDWFEDLVLFPARSTLGIPAPCLFCRQ